MKQPHIPVLLEQTISLLDPKPGEAYLDGTAGYGGHAEAIIARTGRSGRSVLVDRDREAIKALGERFDRAEVIHANYYEVARQLVEDGSLFDIILLDLGVSSPQLDIAARGFSFKNSAPLDMRMDQSQSLTAAEVVNNYPQIRLADLIYRYGEEPRSRAVAAVIVNHRPIKTTAELANIVRRVVRSSGDSDPVTRTFQAIRIEVNEELVSLAAALPCMERLLAPGGRLAVISFHSLEDRIVKQFIDRQSRDCICPPKQPVCTCDHQATLIKLTQKVISGEVYDSLNPRARSAKLRVAAKINTKKQKEER